VGRLTYLISRNTAKTIEYKIQDLGFRDILKYRKIVRAIVFLNFLFFFIDDRVTLLSEYQLHLPKRNEYSLKTILRSATFVSISMYIKYSYIFKNVFDF